MPRPPKPDKAKHPMTVRLTDEQLETVDAIVELFADAIPEARWTRHRVMQLVVEEGLPLLFERAKDRAEELQKLRESGNL